MPTMSNDQPNFTSDLGESFAADGVAIMFREGRVVMDFRKTAPRVDQIGNEQNQTIVTEHQPVLLDPQAAKVMKQILEDNIEEYEQQFGEIEVPEQHEDVDATEPSQNYIG
ncbi:MAG: DUF3467 domain-containing protein [Candidatus Nanohaloarchaea archaeon]|nr:DUF3467 domain-containing protein [Candidatus Nanohaloarchaea archaeon]